MGMGFAPTWLRQVSPPPLLHKTTLTTDHYWRFRSAEQLTNRSISCVSLSVDADERCAGDVVCFPEIVHKDDAKGLYELTYLITVPGRYRLEVLLRGRHVSGSPFVVVCAAADYSPSSRPTTLPARSASKATLAPRTQVPVASGAGTKRPASSPPSNPRSCCQGRSGAAARCLPTAGGFRAARPSQQQQQRHQRRIAAPTAAPQAACGRQKASAEVPATE